MSEHNHSSESAFPGDNSYRTGATKPPKDYAGRMAVLFVALIVLGSVVSGLGLLKGGGEQDSEEQGAVSFESGDMDDVDLPSAGETPVSWAQMGITGEFFSEAYRRYYGLPVGVHITQIAPGSPAEAAGLAEGDILTAAWDTPLSDTESWATAIAEYQMAGIIYLEVYRNQQTLSVALAAAEE